MPPLLLLLVERKVLIRCVKGNVKLQSGRPCIDKLRATYIAQATLLSTLPQIWILPKNQLKHESTFAFCFDGPPGALPRPPTRGGPVIRRPGWSVRGERMTPRSSRCCHACQGVAKAAIWGEWRRAENLGQSRWVAFPSGFEKVFGRRSPRQETSAFRASCRDRQEFVCLFVLLVGGPVIYSSLLYVKIRLFPRV